MDQVRANWAVVGALTVAGLAPIGIAFAISNNAADVWTAILTEIGVAVALLSVLVFLERRVVKRVAEQTAREESRRVTSELETRVRRLEDVDSEQRRQRDEQIREEAAQVQEIRDGAITPPHIGKLLVAAISDRLLDGEHFYVRTSRSEKCPQLFMLPVASSETEEVIVVFLDFEPLEVAHEPLISDGIAMPVPVRTESTVMWIDEDAGAIGAKLQAGLERRNVPTEGFKFGYALDRLLHSVEVMRTARSAPEGDPRRLNGRLRTLINEEWAYTTHGLEGITRDTAFEIRPAGFLASGSGAAPWVGSFIRMSEDDRDNTDEAFIEATEWLKTREGVRVLGPDDDPLQSLFRRGV